jgi:YgiT-type zinc finger domain-containing protein
MSSQFTKPTPETRCPDCGKGVLEFVLVSETFEVDGQQVRVEDLMPYRCPECKALVYPPSEAERARRAVALKLLRQAA